MSEYAEQTLNEITPGNMRKLWVFSISMAIFLTFGAATLIWNSRENGKDISALTVTSNNNTLAVTTLVAESKKNQELNQEWIAALRREMDRIAEVVSAHLVESR